MRKLILIIMFLSGLTLMAQVGEEVIDIQSQTDSLILAINREKVSKRDLIKEVKYKQLTKDQKDSVKLADDNKKLSKVASYELELIALKRETDSLKLEKIK